MKAEIRRISKGEYHINLTPETGTEKIALEKIQEEWPHNWQKKCTWVSGVAHNEPDDMVLIVS